MRILEDQVIAVRQNEMEPLRGSHTITCIESELSSMFMQEANTFRKLYFYRFPHPFFQHLCIHCIFSAFIIGASMIVHYSCLKTVLQCVSSSFHALHNVITGNTRHAAGSDFFMKIDMILTPKHRFRTLTYGSLF